MHELSLCRSLLKIIEKKMEALSPASHVTAIWLEVGALCALDTASLQFYFPFVAENTIADGAKLHILTVPSQAKCLACQQEVNVEKFSPCPLCHSGSLVVQQGTDLIIKKMEVS